MYCLNKHKYDVEYAIYGLFTWNIAEYEGVPELYDTLLLSLKRILNGAFAVIVNLDWKGYMCTRYFKIRTLLDHELSIAKVVDLLITSELRELE